jgi:hypothetical protein
MSVHGTLLLNKKIIFQFQQRMLCTNDVEEQVFFTVKVFTLQNVTITLLGNANEMGVYFYMPTNYTINDVNAKSVVKEISDTDDFNGDRVQRQQVITTTCDIKLKNYA